MPATARYHPDGSGRDGYISTNNGGLRVHDHLHLVSNGKHYTPHVRHHLNPHQMKMAFLQGSLTNRHRLHFNPNQAALKKQKASVSRLANASHFRNEHDCGRTHRFMNRSMNVEGASFRSSRQIRTKKSSDLPLARELKAPRGRKKQLQPLSSTSGKLPSLTVTQIAPVHPRQLLV